MAQEFFFLKQRNIFLRLDLWLFILLLSMSVYPSFNLMKLAWIEDPTSKTNSTFSFLFDHLDSVILEPYTFKVLSPVIVLLVMMIFYLSTFWSIRFKVNIFYQLSSEQLATHVVFYPKPHKGSPDIVKINRISQKPFIIFQQRKFEIDEGKLLKPKYPIDKDIEFYQASKGITNSEFKQHFEYYGQNIYDIPIPSFLQLFKEHIMSPFFIFQIFTIFCMMLDDYLISSLLSLFSLLITEANTVRTRQSNLLELRGMKTQIIFVEVYRDEEWKRIPSSKIVPNDLIFLSNTIISPCTLR